MEWVETTGRTIDDAKEAALDQLGVAEDEAEFDVLEEAKSGLFGLSRREARVRARVRPVQPRPKVERRRGRGRNGGRGDSGGDRDRSGGGKGGGRGRGGRGRSGRGPDDRSSGGQDTSTQEKSGQGKSGQGRAAGKGGGQGSGSGRTRGGGSERGKRQGGEAEERSAPGAGAPVAGEERGEHETTRTTDRTPKRRAAAPPKEDKTMGEPVSVVTQGEQAEEFLEGLLDAFDLDGDIVKVEIDDETIEVQVEGDDLGLLIGPKGQTLQAVQELTRAALQRRADGPLEGRVRLDVGAYRQRRREALERFTRQVAEEVVADGGERALEPMNAADRKVVHDTVNDIDGVSTVSEGEDPRRRVVIVAE